MSSLLALLGSCTSLQEEEAIQGRSNAIIGGSPAPSAIGYSGVVAILNQNDETTGIGCTGTLISPFHVLTAAHCVAGNGYPFQSIRVGFNDAYAGGFAGLPGTSERQEVQPAKCFVHPDRFPAGTPAGDRTCNKLSSGSVDARWKYDIALLYLQPNSSSVGPTRVPPSWHPESPTNSKFIHRIIEEDEFPDPLLGVESWVGETVRLVGFGRSIAPGGAGLGGEGVRRYVDKSVEALIAPGGALSGQAMVVLDGWFTGVTPLTYLGGTVGDSGGPALSMRSEFEMQDRGAPIVGVASSNAFYVSLLEPSVRSWLFATLDADGDGIWQHPDTPDVPGFDPRANSSTDVDGDSVVSARDNCQLDNNPMQFDRDGDGFGNECDTCVGVFNPEQLGIDSDGDGWDDDCDNCLRDFNADQLDGDGDGVGDVCDNCQQANPDQANCNELAELALGAAELGDICDPNPCATSTVSLRSVVVSGGLALEVRQDRITVDGNAVPATSSSLSVGSRYCVCPSADPEECALPVEFGGRVCPIADPNSFTTPPAGQPTWQDADIPNLANVPHNPPTDEDPMLRHATWFLPDHLGAISVRSDVLDGDGIPVSDPKDEGVLWTHSFEGSHDLRLSSSYRGGIFGQSFPALPLPQPCGVYIGPAYEWSAPVPSPGFGGGFPPAGLFLGDCLGPVELEIRVVDDGVGTAVAFDVQSLVPDFWPMPNPVWATPDAVWVFAEEHGPMLPETGPLYAAIPPSLLQGLGPGALWWDGAQLVDAGLSVGPEGWPSERGGFAAALSARAKVLWVGGGQRLGADLTDVWALPLVGDPPRWRRLTETGSLLSRVDGLAYDAYGRQLLAVGPSDDGLEVRLVAVDPESGAATVRGAWPRSAGSTAWYDLAAGRDGTVYLSAATASHYRVLRLDGPTGFLTGYAVGQNGSEQPGVLVRGSLTARSPGVFMMVEQAGDQAFRAHESSDMVPILDPAAWF